MQLVFKTLVSLVALASYVSAMPLAKRAPATVYSKCKESGTFALTFDDGPYEFTPKLLKLLNDNDVKATFFINGKNYANVETDEVNGQSYKDILKQASDAGHQIGSHTYQHKSLEGLGRSEIEQQMNKNSDVIYDAIGKRPAFMRPPKGEIDDNALDVLGELGYRGVIMWDIDSQDWATHNLEKEKIEYNKVLKDGATGHIALNHEVYEQTVNELVPWVIDELKDKVKFVTVAECLGMEPYL
ncbi:chitin deacetylase [Lichtheimia corymbifera JMRC:FSU:9682]|uniref:Chitin deacetylase n=1 Tax=Lichtheimia corymbifera JMRC:FSU:9682 TaxID=1263082 RepID=A0A068RXC3_9FUNG|nr:chitin deacetylase [Lichtheimia corymbifera JMRC:FSU:9682]